MDTELLTILLEQEYKEEDTQLHRDFAQDSFSSGKEVFRFLRSLGFTREMERPEGPDDVSLFIESKDAILYVGFADEEEDVCCEDATEVWTNLVTMDVLEGELTDTEEVEIWREGSYYKINNPKEMSDFKDYIMDMVD